MRQVYQYHWKPVVGFERLYEVSNTGVIRNAKRRRKMRQAKDHCGYLIVQLRQREKNTAHKAHRIVARAFLGDIAPGMVVNHKDCDKTNNRVSNLEYTTQKQNCLHWWESGRADYRMTDRALVEEIRRCYEAEGPLRLSRRLGMSYHTVSCIGQRRRCVTMP